ncbi:MAG: hypothetical protein K2L51_05270 [Clostridiales bacterium]|nr:hypothetical protein [Clostridiales bacterium]
MKDLSFLALLDVYGEALTAKQHEMLSDYYERDFSLSEIADNAGISRQAVHAAIKQAEDSLNGYESKFGVCAFVSELYKRLNDMCSEEGALSDSARQKIAALEDFIRSKYGSVR